MLKDRPGYFLPSIKKGDLVVRDARGDSPQDSDVGIVVDESYRICSVFFPSLSKGATFLKRKLRVISRL